MSNRVVLAGWRQRWNRNLLRFLNSRVREPVNIEDLAQETYLRLLRAPDLTEVRNPRAYLIRVASNVVAEWRHSQPPAAETVDALGPDQLIDECTPDFELSANISQQKLEHVLTTLPAPVRAVVLLRLRDGFTYKDIARTLGFTDRQVRRYLERGYEELRRAFDV